MSGGPDYAYEHECQARHERSNALGNEALEVAQSSRDLLIELTGRSGKNGKIGTIMERIEKLEERDEAREKREREFMTRALIAVLTGGGLVAGLIEGIKALS